MKIQEASENLLSRITLRLMEETERERFDRLLEEEHYLKSSLSYTKLWTPAKTNIAF